MAIEKRNDSDEKGEGRDCQRAEKRRDDREGKN